MEFCPFNLREYICELGKRVKDEMFTTPIPGEIRPAEDDTAKCLGCHETDLVWRGLYVHLQSRPSKYKAREQYATAFDDG